MAAAQRKPRSDAGRNREILISTAREVFAELGVEASLDLVAKRAHLGNATLYRHFPTRESLILETFRLDLHRHMGVIDRASDGPSAWEGFLTWLRFCFHDQLTDIGLTQSLVMVGRGTDPEVDHLRQATLDGIGALIRRAKAEGRFRPDRWLEDVILFLNGHEQFVRTNGASTASARWLELTVDALAARPEIGDGVESPTVVAVRAAMAHRLRGEPIGDGDI
ncbi:AcrR family transcriptional regulator [Catenuloplanes nepalensis]|uniref:AcrR family transcriptional regulator n=1 Tax=Catenuloplanes nepalensis TaxID=587533 RepID=A0ABT9MPJ4_9ACTN|nr:TetR/AcrR family transcriptional regulator [Catenuloplanes nepalensis]MDP9792981.1 AcrR family transcriptional regulator [Catenuloplanes nepalensis]